MRLITHLGLAALASLLAAACGGSPTAPSPTLAATDPVATVLGPGPFPAPVSQTFTGTWYVGDRRFMTLTQRGSSVTGMPAPSMFEAGNGVTVSESGIIDGVVDGETVTLAITELVTLGNLTPAVTCTVGHTFRGAVSGNTLSGTMVAQTTPLECAPRVDTQEIELSTVTGRAIYTRQ